METNIYSTELPSHRDDFYKVKVLEGRAVKLDLDNGEQVCGRSFEQEDDEKYFEIKDMSGEKKLVPRNRILSISPSYRYWLILDEGIAKIAFILPSHIKVLDYGLLSSIHIEDAGGVQVKLSRLARVQTEL